VSRLDQAELAILARSFFIDAFWFDQMGCASPRLVVWCGSPETASEASTRWRRAMGSEIDSRQPDPTSPSAVIAKMTHAADTASTGTVTTIDWARNDMTVATLTDLSELRRDSPGAGLFYEVTLPQLSDLVPHVERRDQTLTHFGFSVNELGSFASLLGARGIDRIVPIGSALDFDRLWDGHDLLTAFSRNVVVRG